jgi:hypothetical protein
MPPSAECRVSSFPTMPRSQSSKKSICPLAKMLRNSIRERMSAPTPSGTAHQKANGPWTTTRRSAASCTRPASPGGSPWLWHGGLHTSFPLYTEALRARLANSTLKRGRSGPHGGAAKRLPKFLSGVSNHRHDAQASNSVTANPITRGKEWPDQPLRRRSGRQGQRQSSAPPGWFARKR